MTTAAACDNAVSTADGGRPGNSGTSPDAATDGSTSPSRCTGFALPGDSFYPEGIERGPDGSIYVGSYVTGEIVVLDEGRSDARQLVAPGGDIVQAVGLRYDDDAELLWACSVDTTGARPSSLVGIDVDTGRSIVRHDLPAGSFCNDVALDASHDVYIADSFASRIHVVRAADRRVADSIELWSSDPSFSAGAMPGGFTLNGIAVRDEQLYVVRSDTGALLRMDILADGSAGAVVAIELDTPLTSGDGILFEPGGDLLVARNFAGRLDRVRLSGSGGAVTNVAMGLDIPATLTLDGERALVTETQFDHLFMPETAGPAMTPFCVAAVPIAAR